MKSFDVKHQTLTKCYAFDFHFIGDFFGHITETWGSGDPETDWKMAAEEAAKRIQNVNEDILIIIGGVNFNIELTPAFEAPIQIQKQVSTK